MPLFPQARLVFRIDPPPASGRGEALRKDRSRHATPKAHLRGKYRAKPTFRAGHNFIINPHSWVDTAPRYKTDSMERRYSIVDAEDFAAAKAAMKRQTPTPLVPVPTRQE